MDSAWHVDNNAQIDKETDHQGGRRHCTDSAQKSNPTHSCRHIAPRTSWFIFGLLFDALKIPKIHIQDIQGHSAQGGSR